MTATTPQQSKQQEQRRGSGLRRPLPHQSSSSLSASSSSSHSHSQSYYSSPYPYHHQNNHHNHVSYSSHHHRTPQLGSSTTASVEKASVTALLIPCGLPGDAPQAHRRCSAANDDEGRRRWWWMGVAAAAVCLVSAAALSALPPSWRVTTPFAWKNGIDNGHYSSPYLTVEEYSASLFPPHGHHQHMDAADGTSSSVPPSDGDACYTAVDCPVGRFCAFPSMHNMSIRICCAEALSLGLGAHQLSSSSSSSTENRTHPLADDEEAQAAYTDTLWLTVCTGASVGEACGSHHALCTSGHCIHGKCAPHGLPAGRPCPDDGACASHACGRYAYDTSRDAPPQRCCASGRRLVVDAPDDLPYPVSFCHGSAAAGEPCGGHDELCQDGLVCRHDVCTAADDALSTSSLSKGSSMVVPINPDDDTL